MGARSEASHTPRPTALVARSPRWTPQNRPLKWLHLQHFRRRAGGRRVPLRTRWVRVSREGAAVMATRRPFRREGAVKKAAVPGKVQGEPCGTRWPSVRQRGRGPTPALSGPFCSSTGLGVAPVRTPLRPRNGGGCRWVPWAREERQDTAATRRRNAPPEHVSGQKWAWLSAWFARPGSRRAAGTAVVRLEASGGRGRGRRAPTSALGPAGRAAAGPFLATGSSAAAWPAVAGALGRDEGFVVISGHRADVRRDASISLCTRLRVTRTVASVLAGHPGRGPALEKRLGGDGAGQCHA